MRSVAYAPQFPERAREAPHAAPHDALAQLSLLSRRRSRCRGGRVVVCCVSIIPAQGVWCAVAVEARARARANRRASRCGSTVQPTASGGDVCSSSSSSRGRRSPWIWPAVERPPPAAHTWNAFVVRGHVHHDVHSPHEAQARCEAARQGRGCRPRRGGVATYLCWASASFWSEGAFFGQSPGRENFHGFRWVKLPPNPPVARSRW